MKYEVVPDRRGTTLDHGRIVVTELGEDGWVGFQRNGRDVLIVFRKLRLTPERDAYFRYEVPGLARLAFLGVPDVGDGLVLAEEKPNGDSLADTGPLDERETVQLGIDLCEVILEWAARREELTGGFRPESVYVAGDPGSRRFSGAAPRIELLRDRHTNEFEAPAQGSFVYTADDVGFLVARMLWIALLEEDPYDLPHTAMHNNLWENRRRAWTGPSELGRILEQVLVVDDRMPVAKFRNALLDLQTRLSKNDSRS